MINLKNNFKTHMDLNKKELNFLLVDPLLAKEIVKIVLIYNII
jgi:hypothetical protein